MDFLHMKLNLTVLFHKQGDILNNKQIIPNNKQLQPFELFL